MRLDAAADTARTAATAAAWAVLNKQRAAPAGRVVGRAANATARVRVIVEPAGLVRDGRMGVYCPGGSAVSAVLL